ncbi:uncharacterized protein BCR38DRAFT_412519 [Pseudomassariella vexata]|uniref:Ubiquitin 3 binding protein But2 C-terminal domain-containing protein n=1 Tax=Pseudomassariella vexata TaxID=1141098 RepID=A0A1Y2DK27_9PEZI|nr:uncharacterized protein BCR38DRAFT_412519 [Pseudomassariella vexata]ORY59504.1 hypothetical protein BCR38DRAFT_412519 [Pseudomassariella vexata]
MKSSLAFLFAVGAHAALPTRQESSCTFGLRVSGPNHEHLMTGFRGRAQLIGGGVTFHRYWIGVKGFTDYQGHQCSIQPEDQQLACQLTVPDPPTIFRIAPKGDGTKLLTHDQDNKTKYLACTDTWGGKEFSTIFSISKENNTECYETEIMIADEECSTSSTQPTLLDAPSPAFDDVDLNSTLWDPVSKSDQEILPPQDDQALNLREPPASFSTRYLPSPTDPPTQKPRELRQAVTASQSCSVSPSSPSIAPTKVGYPEQGAPDGLHATSPNVSITPTDSTIFEYSVPKTFATKGQQLCGLQFRLPFCSTLEPGYPCFSFSGSEQEMGSNSGMNLALLEDDGFMSWNDTELHQVYPGEMVTFGTFECGTDVTSGAGDRKISWLVGSVRNFGLKFMQAGICPDAQFKDGVGAWIVQCS